MELIGVFEKHQIEAANATRKVEMCYARLQQLNHTIKKNERVFVELNKKKTDLEMAIVENGTIPEHLLASLRLETSNKCVVQNLRRKQLDASNILLKESIQVEAETSSLCSELEREFNENRTLLQNFDKTKEAQKDLEATILSYKTQLLKLNTSKGQLMEDMESYNAVVRSYERASDDLQKKIDCDVGPAIEQARVKEKEADASLVKECEVLHELQRNIVSLRSVLLVDHRIEVTENTELVALCKASTCAVKRLVSQIRSSKEQLSNGNDFVKPYQLLLDTTQPESGFLKTLQTKKLSDWNYELDSNLSEAQSHFSKLESKSSQLLGPIQKKCNILTQEISTLAQQLEELNS